MALQTYSRFTPEDAVSGVDFSGTADGVVVLTDCTSVTLTLEDTTAVDLGDTPGGSCIAQRCTKIAFTGGTVKAFFLPA